MSCGARLPVYTLLIGAFFGASGYGGTVLFGVYLLGIIVAVAVALVLRHTTFKGEQEPFVMEMPPYHIPTLKGVLMHMWERSVLYLKKAGTFILGASIIVWFLTAYPMDVQYSQDFDAAKDQVSAQMEQKQADILQTYGLTSIDQNSELNGMYESMIAAATLLLKKKTAKKKTLKASSRPKLWKKNRSIPMPLLISKLRTRRFMRSSSVIRRQSCC